MWDTHDTLDIRYLQVARELGITLPSEPNSGEAQTDQVDYDYLGRATELAIAAVLREVVAEPR